MALLVSRFDERKYLAKNPEGYWAELPIAEKV
jgi:hypothetical protein